MSEAVRFLAVGLPLEILEAFSARLDGVVVTNATTAQEAIEAARVTSFEMILINDATIPLDGIDTFNELKEACGSRPFRLAYCTDAHPDPAVAVRFRNSVDVERIFYRPFDLEEMLREIARSTGVELLPPVAAQPGNSGASAQLIAIWERFRGATLARIDVLEDAAIALLENRLDRDLLSAATREAHKLAGSSGTFGFPEASKIAREIEQRLSKGRLEQSDALLLSEQLIVLRRDLEGSPPVAGSDSTPSPASGRRRVLVLEPDNNARERLVMEAEGRGLATFEAATVSAARVAILQFRPHAVIVAFEKGSENRVELDFLDEIQQSSPSVPTIVVAPRGGLVDRVAIARRGASRRLEHSVSPSVLIDAVLGALQETGDEQPTVLAVDDDPHILQAIRALLSPSGIRVETVGDPLLFWDSLDASNPDLVILDIDMPHVSGIELCRALRNDDRWATMPVLFLTSRSDPASVQRIFAAGADDHIGKPISESELVMRLNNRLDRVRQLRQQAESDSLTRVATKRKALELMRRFVRLARRNSTSFSVAIVDVDDLKSINSDYGHPSGDDVLRAIALLLSSSLRAEDIVGRWGGDEFVVGFYGSGKKEAATRLETIRDDFSSQTFRSDDAKPFHASFSAGVAQMPEDGIDIETLISAADAAGLEARHDPKERVRCAGVSDTQGIEYVDIALIEDDESLVGLLRHGFETAGFLVRSFGDGEVAVAALGGDKPILRARLIILDVDLPALNGYDVLRRLGADGVVRAAKVIMLTARNAEADVLSGLGLGAIDHVNKPFSLPVLMRKVSSALSSGSG